MWRYLRYIWVFPATVVALPVVLITRLQGGSLKVVDGVLEVHGGVVTRILSSGWLPWIGSAAAMTLGHVVLGRDEMMLDYTRKHERVHVRQYELWGPFFLPAYGLSSLYCWIRGRNPYLDNVFEREAFAEAP